MILGVYLSLRLVVGLGTGETEGLGGLGGGGRGDFLKQIWIRGNRTVSGNMHITREAAIEGESVDSEMFRGNTSTF